MQLRNGAKNRQRWRRIAGGQGDKTTTALGSRLNYLGVKGDILA
ncbi:hypothetical protein Q3C01_13170 [Bradyrhizobium sp. UFLA05-109]